MLDTQIARGHKVGINEAFYVRNVEPGERERPYYRNRSCLQLYSFPKKKNVVQLNFLEICPLLQYA